MRESLFVPLCPVFLGLRLPLPSSLDPIFWFTSLYISVSSPPLPSVWICLTSLCQYCSPCNITTLWCAYSMGCWSLLPYLHGYIRVLHKLTLGRYAFINCDCARRKLKIAPQWFGCHYSLHWHRSAGSYRAVEKRLAALWISTPPAFLTCFPTRQCNIMLSKLFSIEIQWQNRRIARCYSSVILLVSN